MNRIKNLGRKTISFRISSKLLKTKLGLREKDCKTEKKR